MHLQELFQQGYSWEWIEQCENVWDAAFETNKKTAYSVTVSQQSSDDRWTIEFASDNGYGITDSGDAFRVFTTVYEILKAFIDEVKPEFIEFEATHKEPSRCKLYAALSKRLSNNCNGYDIRTSGEKDGYDAFVIKRQDQPQNHEMSEGFNIVESISAIHRTSKKSAADIRDHGFDLSCFGSGAGAGTGEPAGVYVSVGDGSDFSNENTKRNLGLDDVLYLELNVNSILKWDREERLAFTASSRMEFIRSKFDISEEDATAIIRYMVRILKVRPDLDDIADWLSTRIGEREFAMFLNRKLRAQGYDAVQYRDPWQGVDQLIVLDPRKIKIIG